MIQLSNQIIGQVGNNKVPQKDQPKTSSPQNKTIEDILIKDNSFKSPQSAVLNLLNQLAKGETSKSQMARMISQAESFSPSQNVSKDLKELIQVLEKSPQLKAFANKIKEFLIPIENLKSSTLPNQIKQSGIMLESTLRQEISKDQISKQLLSLIKDIKDNIIAKNSPILSSKTLLIASSQLLSASKIQKQDLSIFKEMLSKNIQDLKANFTESKISDFLSTFKKIENLGKFIENSFHKAPNNDIVKINQALDKVLNALSNDIKKYQGSLLGDNLSLKDMKVNENLNQIKSLITLVNTMKEKSQGIINQPNDPKALSQNSQLPKEALLDEKIISNLNAKMSGETLINMESLKTSLHEQIKIITKRLELTLTLMDKKAMSSGENYSQSKEFLKSLDQITKNFSNQPQSSQILELPQKLQADMKNTLLQLQNNSQFLKTTDGQNIQNHVNKLVAQIEMHQFISYVSDTIHCYIPFSWGEMERGLIAFKKGKKDKFYCKIDLNFLKFGRINIMLGLHKKKYLEVSIATEKDLFKQRIQDSLQGLKIALNDLGFIIKHVSLNTLAQKDKKSPYNEWEKFDLGMDVKV